MIIIVVFGDSELKQNLEVADIDLLGFMMMNDYEI